MKKLSKQTDIKDLQTALADIKLMAGSIAHEQKNYLAGVKITVAAMQPVLATLIDGYQRAVDAKLITTSSKYPHPVPERITQQVARLVYGVDRASKMISLQLNAINHHHGHINTDNFSQCSINEVVNNALDSYPFDDTERAQLNWQPATDFYLSGEFLLSQHVLWNLLLNALAIIKDAGHGDITLWVEPGKEYNRLYIKDTGPGIPETLLNQIFSLGVSKRSGGSGVGLAFCKAVMQAYGGDIECRSEVGKYTQFILSFPVI